MIHVHISAREHDQAHVASCKLRIAPAGGLALLRDRLAEQLRISVRWAEEKDLFIGHIKAYLQWGEEDALMLSTTGGAVEVKGSALPEAEPAEAEVGVTAIVFGGDLQQVEDRLEGISAAMAGQYGDWCEFEHDCEHHHHHHGEDCDCGCHEHGHEHHHHGEDCDCGCDEHGHEHHHHHHGEDCDCHEHGG